MWYRFASLQDEIEKLRSQGIDESLLAIFSDPKYDNPTKGRMLGAIKQNPNISIQELENLSNLNKPTREEKFILDNFENEKFKNWLFHKLKSWRIEPKKPNGEYDHDMPQGGYGDHGNFLELALHMQDFVNSIQINDPDYNLGLKTWEQVVQDTEQWEETLRGRGDGKFYNPADRVVVMAYPDGWNMVQVISENDLDVEGAKMNHCIRGESFGGDVKSGRTKIFSLRTPTNQPIVSIEVINGNVKQIKGHNNKRIEDHDLVEKIKDFFDDRDDIKKQTNKESPIAAYFDDWEERVDWNYNPEDLGYNITYCIYGPDESEYDPYEDELIEDFNRFGIISPIWDHKQFAENNLDNADIPDIMNAVIKEIKEGMSRSSSRYNFYNEDYKLEDYPIEEYVDTFYTALIDKALLSLQKNHHNFERYLDVNGVLSKATEKYEEAKNEYEETDKKLPFMEWYEQQPEYMYFLLANKIQNFFENSKFAFEYKEKTGNNYKLPSGRQKYHWDSEEIEPYIQTQPIVDLYEKQKINDRSQLRLFAPTHEIQEKDNQQIDKLTERPMTQKDENWAYAGVYNNKNYKKGS